LIIKCLLFLEHQKRTIKFIAKIMNFLLRMYEKSKSTMTYCYQSNFMRTLQYLRLDYCHFHLVQLNQL
jgi:hypothetical protein